MSTEDFFGSVEEFVEYCEGDHVIKKVLIANNGIGALKAIRSVRKWAYQTFGNERMVMTLMYIVVNVMSAAIDKICCDGYSG